MTIAYNLGIPAAGNNPSTDQPNMMENNDNIPTLISVDHVNFGVSGSGQHLQVTFNSNNVPAAAPYLPPVLFTQNDASSIPQLFFYTGSDAQSKDQYVAATNGSTMLPGGIIIKWGFANLPNSGFNQPVTFPVEFPHNCFSVVAIANAASNTVTVASCTALNVGGFTAIKTSAGTAININYIAIGN
jgi:hypothetical protein